MSTQKLVSTEGVNPLGEKKQYFTLLTTCGEYQVLRMFLLVAEMEKGCRAQSSVIEIGHYWWNDAGRQALVAIQRTFGHIRS